MILMKISVFSSGSSGNCTLVRANDYNILIDVGISKKSLDENLLEYNLTLNDIQVLLITHEHTDHTKGFNAILKYENIKIYLTKGTYHYILSSNKDKNPRVYDKMVERLENGSISLLNRLDNSIFYQEINLYETKVSVLPTFHDASESVGFIIHENDKKVVYITDTGYVHEALFDMISNADAYVLESNHDPAILMHSNRPYHLKMRILSNHGHLSNEDSMVVLANTIGVKTKLVMHAHISQECNLTHIVELTRKKVLGDYGIDTSGVEFVILSPNPTKEYEL